MIDVIEQLKAECRERGIEYHPRHGEETLRSLLADADSGDTAPAPTPNANEAPAGHLVCTVTKAGDGKIHNGAGGYYKRRDTFHMPEKPALALEARAYVETD